MHTILEDAEIVALLSREIVSDDGRGMIDQNKPKFLKSQDTAKVIIKTARPVCLEKFEDFPELGRFAMRLETYTVGLGKVLKFKPLNKAIIKDNYFFKKEK